MDPKPVDSATLQTQDPASIIRVPFLERCPQRRDLRAAMMITVFRKDETGQFVASFGLPVMGWLATSCMAAVGITMFSLS